MRNRGYIIDAGLVVRFGFGELAAKIKNISSAELSDQQIFSALCARELLISTTVERATDMLCQALEIPSAGYEHFLSAYRGSITPNMSVLSELDHFIGTSEAALVANANPILEQLLDELAAAFNFDCFCSAEAGATRGEATFWSYVVGEMPKRLQHFVILDDDKDQLALTETFLRNTGHKIYPQLWESSEPLSAQFTNLSKLLDAA